MNNPNVGDDGRKQHREGVKAKVPFSSRKEWKERLRAECLLRARRKRIEVLSRARRTKEVSPFAASNVETPLRNIANDVTAQEAKSIVQESLALSQESASSSSPPPYSRNNETSLLASTFSSPIPTHSLLPNQRFGFQTPQDRQSFVQKQDEILTEDELISLMREVEEELQKEEATLLREMEEAEKNNALEQEMLEYQIASFESWQNEGTSSMDAQMEDSGCSNSVRCPVCQLSQVIVTNAGVILCRRFNRNSPQSCPLRIDSHTEGMSLPMFTEMLHEAYTRHGHNCSCHLTFQMQQRFGIIALHALCGICGFDAIVV